MVSNILYHNATIDRRNVMEKKIFRSNSNKKLAGVCGGIGEYFGIDPTLIRLAWVLMSLFVGAGLIAYIIAAIIIPQNPYTQY